MGSSEIVVVEVARQRRFWSQVTGRLRKATDEGALSLVSASPVGHAGGIVDGDMDELPADASNASRAMMLEIVPERDPTLLRVGDELTVTVLKNGQPLRDFTVGFAAAHQKTGANRKTDSGGRVSFRLDRTGWWLIRATHLAHSTAPNTDWESHF